MIIDDSIVLKYLSGQPPESYSDCWIYNNLGFESPDLCNKEWVLKLYNKLKYQIENFIPRNYETVKRLFPCFDDVANDYTIMLVVGFPDPYDAMVLNNNGVDYMVFDLIQFTQEALNEDYSCHRVLTHELIHICLRKNYPEPFCASYTERLDYTAFDEGFAHALTYPENLSEFQFDDFLSEKYHHAKQTLAHALAETDPEKQKKNY